MVFVFLLLHSVLPSKFTHVVANDYIFLFFKKFLSFIPLYGVYVCVSVYRMFFIHPSIDECLGCFIPWLL